MRGRVVVAMLAACAGAPSVGGAKAPGPPTVEALSFPAWYLVKRIGGSRVQAQISIPAGEDPATWQPSGEVVSQIAKADLIVLNGLGYEAWAGTASLPYSKLVNTGTAAKGIEIEGPTHSHGADGNHSHQVFDPHTWADPANYLLQAGVVRDALVKADPAGEAVYQGQYQGLKRQLDELGPELDAGLKALGQRPLASNSASFTYWAGRSGVPMVDLSLDASAPPSAERVAEITAAHPEGGVLLWDARPTAEITALLPSFQHLSLDPLQRPGSSGSYDYVAQMRVNLALITKAAASKPAAVTDAP